jgi:ribosomal protein S6--L-glutamate ligase
LRATKAMRLQVAGVDLLESRSGPKVLEINSSPGLEGIERTTGADVAGAVVEYAVSFARRRRPAPAS